MAEATTEIKWKIEYASSVLARFVFLLLIFYET